MTPGTVWTMSSEEKQPAEMKTGPKVSDQLENLKSKKKKTENKKKQKFLPLVFAVLSSSAFIVSPAFKIPLAPPPLVTGGR